MKNNHLLIPTDFSENAKNALNYALGLFKDKDIKITFLNVYHVPAITPEMPADIIYQAIESSQKAAKQELAALCREITESYTKVQCDYRVKQEPLSDACKETIVEKNIDLVIMGTHGASGVKKLLFGSNAASVISNVPCPVLAIPEKAKFRKMKSVLFASDYHDSDVDSIAALAEIAKPFDAEVIVAHISEEKDSDSGMLQWFEGVVKKKTDYAKILFFLLAKADIAEGLENFIRNNEVDMLAMSTRKRSPFARIFAPSLTKKMVFHTHIPLLAFHALDAENSHL